MVGMEPVDSIGRLGFSRWYERRLIEAHAWFVSAFFCMVAIAACMEELSFRGSLARLLLYALIVFGSVVIGAYARFKVLAGSQVRCRKCNHEWRLIGPE